MSQLNKAVLNLNILQKLQSWANAQFEKAWKMQASVKLAIDKVYICSDPEMIDNQM